MPSSCRTDMASQFSSFYISKLLALPNFLVGSLFRRVWTLLQTLFCKQLNSPLQNLWTLGTSKTPSSCLPNRHGISTFKPFCTDNLLAFRYFLIGYLSNRIWTYTTSLAIIFWQKSQFFAPRLLTFGNLTQ